VFLENCITDGTKIEKLMIEKYELKTRFPCLVRFGIVTWSVASCELFDECGTAKQYDELRNSFT
jgi:hypothetical protein